MTAKGKESTWNNSSNFGYNSLLMNSRFTAAMWGQMNIVSIYDYNNRIGDQVLPAKETLLGQIWSFLNPREW